MHIKLLQQALKPNYWHQANQDLVCKMITEFLYEDLLESNIVYQDNCIYQHHLTINKTTYYQFNAESRIFGQWHIDSNSILRVHNDNHNHKISAKQFIIDVYPLIGIDELTLGHFLREINHTLLADCHIMAHSQASSKALLQLPNHQLEGYMHGHPWFVINKGRLGFAYNEYFQYAPELRNTTQLIWMAVSKNKVHFNSISGLSYSSLIEDELSQQTFKKFNSQLIQLQLNTNDYYLMPTHEWQWQQQLVYLFANEIAEQSIVYLGPGEDDYIPTQSIRTFSHYSKPMRRQVKLPLSILNTAVYRGLPSERTRLAPMLSEWLQQKYLQDTFLSQQCRFILLGEVASIDFPHPDYESLSGVSYQYKELLGVIWRESIDAKLHSNEKAITMAAMLHIDPQGEPFICELIKRSGLSIQQWLNKFFAVNIPPLLHWLYHYGLVFSPHGENTLLITENLVPTGMAIKDFIDDVNITEHDIPELDDLPQALREILLRVPDNEMTQFIHTGLFVVLYRYISDILQSYANYPETLFWQQVNLTIKNYHNEHPELRNRFKQFEILTETFNKMCLNRLRLLSVGYGDYAERPKVDITMPMRNPAYQAIGSEVVI